MSKLPCQVSCGILTMSSGRKHAMVGVVQAIIGVVLAMVSPACMYSNTSPSYKKVVQALI